MVAGSFAQGKLEVALRANFVAMFNGTYVDGCTGKEMVVDATA